MSNKNNKPNPYEILLQFDWIKITSNIDNEFYKAHYEIIPHALVNNTTFPLPEIAVSPKELKKITHSFSDKTEMNFDTIYHIHGSLDNLGETILTTKDCKRLINPIFTG